MAKKTLNEIEEILFKNIEMVESYLRKGHYSNESERQIAIAQLETIEFVINLIGFDPDELTAYFINTGTNK